MASYSGHEMDSDDEPLDQAFFRQWLDARQEILAKDPKGRKVQESRFRAALAETGLGQQTTVSIRNIITSLKVPKI